MGKFRWRAASALCYLTGSLFLGLPIVGGLWGSAAKAGAAYRNSASHSINNDSSYVDYKLSDSQIKDLQELLSLGVMSDVTGDETPKYRAKNPQRYISTKNADSKYAEDGNKSESNEAVTAKSYLIENNLLERKATITRTGKNPKVVLAEDAGGSFHSVFVDAYSRYRKFNIGTKQAAKEHLAGYIGLVESKVLGGKFADGGYVGESEVQNVKDRLSEYQDSLKEDLKEVSPNDEESIGTVYLGYLQRVKNYCMKYDNGLRVMDEEAVKKSDFLMLLDKVSFGVRASRPVYYLGRSYRTANKYSMTGHDYWNGSAKSFLSDYWDTKDKKGDAKFLGDYFYYVSSNVYELYLADLLNRGVIFEDELGQSGAAKNFLKCYRQNVGRGEWNPDSGLAPWGSDALGAGYLADGNSYVPKAVSFFADEGMTRMDIYQYVEDVMRQSEKDATDLELGIVSYKYGLKFLQQYSGFELRTLKYLIAKGVLDFEDEGEFYSLDQPATNQDAYVMLYRLHNKGARFGFSEVQLTDSDSYWQEKGYAEDEVAVNTLSSGYLMSDGSAKRVEGGTAVAGRAIMFGGLFSVASAAGSPKNDYRVTYYLSTDVGWKYDNVPIKNIAEGSKSHKEVISVKQTEVKYNGKKAPVYKAVFRVQAASEGGAVSKVKNRLMAASGQTNTVHCVTKVTGVQTKSSYTLISQSQLKTSFSDISIIEDKVLLNTKTGVQAVLLPDMGYALVGNTVLRTDTLIVEHTATGGETYYNLNLISSLLDNAFLKQIGYTRGIYLTPKNLDGHNAPVYSEYGDTGKVLDCGRVNVTKPMARRNAEISAGDDLYYYRVDGLSDGVSTLSRSFSVKNGKKKYNIILVVDWMFAIPEVDQFDTRSGSKISRSLASSKVLKNSELNKYLYTRPEDSKVLQAWWDSNYVACNALANFMYGTDNTEYITTGYIVPQLSILCPENSAVKSSEDAWVSKLFTGFKCYAYGEKTGKASEIENYFGSGADWSSWYVPYYSGETCFNWLNAAGCITSEEYDVLVDLANNYRVKNVYYGYKSSKYSSYLFGDVFLRTEGGSLYRNFDDDRKRLSATVKNRKVTKVTVQTHSDTFVNPSKNAALVQNGNDTSHLMLYKGTKEIGGETYYVLSPVSHACVRKPDSALYNAGYAAYSGNAGTKREVTFCVDRNGSGDPDSSWKELYKAWQKTYLGNSGLHSFLNCGNAFAYDRATYKAAKRNGVSFKWNDTYYSIGNKKATHENAYLAVHPFSSAYGVKRSFNIGPYAALNTFAVMNKIIDQESKKSIKAFLRTMRFPSEISGMGWTPPIVQTRSAGMFGDKKTVDSQYVVFAVPRFYVPASDYRMVSLTGSQGQGMQRVKLVASTYSSAVRYGNYYYSGVAETVRDAIIADYVGVRNIKTLGKDTQVSIAGVRFFVEGTDGNHIWLESSPLNVNNTRKPLVRAASAWRRKASTQKAFKSEVEKIFNGINVQCDGAYYPFINYVMDKKKNGLKSGIQIAGLSTSKACSKYGLVYQKGNNAWGYKNGKSKQITKQNSSRYQYVRIKVRLNGKLKVRPLDKEGRRWTLAPITDTGNIGYGSDTLAFYGENLSYDDNQYANVSLDSTLYSPSQAFLVVKQKFQKSFRKAFLGDVKSLVLMLIIAVSVYLCIMSWLAYLVLHYGVLVVFFEAIAAGPGGRTGNGIDILKLVTFGFYTLDSVPSLARVIFIQVGCAIVAAAAYGLM